MKEPKPVQPEHCKHKWSAPVIAKLNSFTVYAVVSCEHCGEIKRKDIVYD